jgi:antitoxin MazE
MRTSLRKMGNSTGMIVPRSILGAIGVTTGAAMDLRVEDGKLIATPAERVGRDGWAEAAANVAATDQEQEQEQEQQWRGFGVADDAKLAW